MEKRNEGERLLAMMRGYQVPCLLAAAAELDLFEALAAAPRTAREAARASGCDPRGVTILLDALSAVELLEKQDGRYAITPALLPYLSAASPRSVVAMLRHQANCLRRWSRLPWTIRTGKPDDPGPGIRGEAADLASFIEAMHVVSRDLADDLVAQIHPGGVRCVLDLGGASGSWTTAWLRAEPQARAIVFDRPQVIPMARARLAGSPFADRVELQAGDFLAGRLPHGADLAWVSAIIHQNPPALNRALYRRIARALRPPGWIFIRDVVLEPSRTRPVAGALFAMNMLSATDGGNSYGFDEIAADLRSAGFAEIELVRRDDGMHSVVRARLRTDAPPAAGNAEADRETAPGPPAAAERGSPGNGETACRRTGRPPGGTAP